MLHGQGMEKSAVPGLCGPVSDLKGTYPREIIKYIIGFRSEGEYEARRSIEARKDEALWNFAKLGEVKGRGLDDAFGGPYLRSEIY